MLLDKDILELKGVGKIKAQGLNKLGLYKISDLLTYYPRRYEDQTTLTELAKLKDGMISTVFGKVVDIVESKVRKGLTLTKIQIIDENVKAELIYFNQPFVKSKFFIGLNIVASGKVSVKFRNITISNPQIVILKDKNLYNGRILSVYNINNIVNQKLLHNIIATVLKDLVVKDFIPVKISKSLNLIDRASALKNIHFPKDEKMLMAAKNRLIFEELFLLQCGMMLLKKITQQQHCGIEHSADGSLVKQLKAKLPFALTNDQKKVLREIKADMETEMPMQRLLQGDVGSGKTIIAMLLLVKTVENGYQGALMVPTEILAQQHYNVFCEYLEPLKMKIGLLSSKLTKKERQEILIKLNEGTIDIVIGTHALIQKDVEFFKLGLAITDEQHRFGVRQRADLKAKGKLPDVLVMTATPIPRTMSLTVYGDLDVSTIRELPPGRKLIRTFVRNSVKRELIYDFVLKELLKGRQAYVVCPLIEESENIDAVAVVAVYDELRKSVFKDVKCALLHGGLNKKEKESVMAEFVDGKIKVLFATTVIEVGVNVPNASVMVVEGAERFGLAQLHQLRGRIGRGEYQSYCILITDGKSTKTKERLGIMEKTNDGFVLAEEDLKIRGPGHFLGTKQHGLPNLKIADLTMDLETLFSARDYAMQAMVEPENIPLIIEGLRVYFGECFSEITGTIL